MKRIFQKKKIVVLGVVLFLYALVITPLIIMNLQERQDPRGRAQTTPWATTQTITSQCSPTGEAQLAYSFTNNEPTRTLKVTITDNKTQVSQEIGDIAPQETVTDVLTIPQQSLPSGEATVTLSWTGLFGQSEEKKVAYDAISCQPEKKTTTAAAVCGTAPTDAMLVIDRSGSMQDRNGSSGTKMSNAKTAAKSFVDILAASGNNQLGLVSFHHTATLDIGLTTNYAAVKNEIDSLNADGGTCIECAIVAANQDFTAQTQANRTNIKKAIILLTDGKATTIVGNTHPVDTSLAEERALTAAEKAYNDNGIVFYTIGLGSDVNESFLQEMATSTGGRYYFSPSTDQLQDVYKRISQILSNSSISGFVFNDLNKNGAYNQGEAKLSGWTLELSGTGLTTPRTTTTSNTGSFSFNDVCNGTYTLKQKTQQGWKQTLPANGGTYAVTINGNSPDNFAFGNAVVSRCSDGIDNDKNGYIDEADSTCHTDGNPKNPNSYDPDKDGEHGGNTCADSRDNNNNGLIDGADPVCHTDGDLSKPWNPDLPEINPPTPTTEKTIFSLTVLQHGIGSAGDNTNPESSLSNKNPVHKTIDAELFLYNTANELVASGTGKITYNPTGGNYKGDVSISPSSIPSGEYYLKIKTPYHLRRLMEGIQNITGGQTNTALPAVTLVAGDVTNDNVVNILDYNGLLDCYSDLAVAVACDNNKKIAADLNDDGSVNQFDYNLFLREISTQPGE